MSKPIENNKLIFFFCGRLGGGDGVGSITTHAFTKITFLARNCVHTFKTFEGFAQSKLTSERKIRSI